jgi:hypothetical protein
VYTLAIAGIGPIATMSSTIDWTGAWPPVAIGPVELIDIPWYLASAAPKAPTGIALLGKSSTDATSLAFGFADPVNGGFSELGTTTPKVIEKFITADKEGNFFVGSAAYNGTGYETFQAGWFTTKGMTSYVGPIDLGCPVFNSDHADGIAVPGGWLFARGLHGECTGSKALVRITRFTDGMQQTVGDVDIENDSPSKVDLLPRPGGAWLLYENWNDANFGFVAARLDASGSVELGPIVLSIPGFQEPIMYAADALDDGLIAVVGGEWLPTSIEYAIAATDEQGVPISSALLSGAVEPWSVPQIAFDHATRQALVVVVSSPNSSAGESLNRIHVARFSCE